MTAENEFAILDPQSQSAQEIVARMCINSEDRKWVTCEKIVREIRIWGFANSVVRSLVLLMRCDDVHFLVNAIQ